MPGSLQWSLYLRFHHQNHVHASPLPHMHYMPHPSHDSAVQIVKCCITQLSPASRYVILRKSIHWPQYPVLIPSMMWETPFHPHTKHHFIPIQNNKQIIILYILIFMFLFRRWKDELNGSSITQCNLPIIYWWMEFWFRVQFYSFTPLLQRNMIPPSSGFE
jgi:hypothetical protein